MKPAVIHQTDLFHSYNDPDDHWDLACQYALAYSGDIELKGILIDYPPMEFGDPSIQAVNQLNYITGLSVPVAVGVSEPMKVNDGLMPSDRLTPGYSGINMVLDALKQAPEPVVIHIVGSCRDIAIAAKLHPGLFKEKCGAIYLNVGSSSPDSKLEYNVALDPVSYSAIFGIECPIYWMPCFEVAPEPPGWQFEMGQYGTYYKFLQGEILPGLSEPLQKYFLYALGKATDNKWLSYLRDPLNKRMLDFFSKLERSMYCTGGFFHTAGKTVTAAGNIVNLRDNPKDPVFSFEPVEIECDEKGFVKWRFSEHATNRYIFKVNDLSRYQPAMTCAMKSLLMQIK